MYVCELGSVPWVSPRVCSLGFLSYEFASLSPFSKPIPLKKAQRRKYIPDRFNYHSVCNEHKVIYLSPGDVWSQTEGNPWY